MSTYIIAEAGVNHNGNLETALQLCNAAKDAGADAVKFQTWVTEKIVGKETLTASYQAKNIDDFSQSQYEMLKKLELSYDDFFIIQKHCKAIGIDFLSTPDEEDSLKFLVEKLHLPLIKIGSGEVTNIPYLRKIGSYGLPVILSTGMSSLGQVAIAFETLMNSGAKKIILLHCTTNYPCPYNEVNLNAMLTLRDAFKCPTGYSDHTMGIDVPIAAAALGACVIEKHFTLNKEMSGPDHKASLDPVELKQMVEGIRNIEKALGDGFKKPNRSELEISKVVQKSIVAKREIAKGEILNEQNITVKRINGGCSAAYWDLVIGKKSPNNYNIDDPICINLL